MAKRKQPRRRASNPAPRHRVKAALLEDPTSEGGQISYSDLSLHDLFAQQARTLLDRAGLDEEQKQSILVAMSCPCCGAGGMSFTAKLKRRT